MMVYKTEMQSVSNVMTANVLATNNESSYSVALAPLFSRTIYTLHSTTKTKL